MRVTPAVPITPAKLTSSTASDVFAPTAYNAGTNYAFGALASGIVTGTTGVLSGTGDFTIYESLQNGNIGHNPLTEPLWWRVLGPQEAAYSTAVTYVLGATASYNQRVYESLQASNANNLPPVLPETENAWWTDVGPTNKFAMVDMASNTQTVSASTLTAVFAPGMRVNTIGFTGLSATSITVTATSRLTGVPTDVVVFGPRTTDLVIRRVLNGYDYAFEPFGTQPSLVYFDVPPYSDIVFTITISNSNGNVKCGSVVVGTYIYLGDTRKGANGDALNFSTIERDLYGKATLIPRRSVPKISVNLLCPSIYVNKVRVARANLNAVPALYTGLDDGSNNYFDMLALVGIYKVFEINAAETNQANITLEVEEI